MLTLVLMLRTVFFVLQFCCEDEGKIFTVFDRCYKCCGKRYIASLQTIESERSFLHRGKQAESVCV